jgi:hypothetical protein
MNHATIEKAPGACNTEGFDTDTNTSNSPTSSPPCKAIEPPPVPIPNMAAILAALTTLVDAPDVFSFQSLTIKTSKKEALEGTTK